MEKYLKRMFEEGEEKEILLILSELSHLDIQVIGAGDEKKYGRKTVITQGKDLKWNHFYGESYKKCLKKARNKNKKRKVLVEK